MRYKQFDSLQDMLKSGPYAQVGAGAAPAGIAPPPRAAPGVGAAPRASGGPRAALEPFAAAAGPSWLSHGSFNPLQVSTLYYEVIDLPLPEYESLMNFKVLQSAAAQGLHNLLPCPAPHQGPTLAALPSAVAVPARRHAVAPLQQEPCSRSACTEPGLCH